jgi:hypothetical protein
MKAIPGFPSLPTSETAPKRHGENENERENERDNDRGGGR